MKSNFFKHLKTIQEHRKLVRQGCFRIGLFYQGLTHDLSKFTPTEFIPGVKYYQGFRSPNNAEREKKGYSLAWMHHKGRNKHHYEYWNDYSVDGKRGAVVPVRMPKRYLAEMYADRVAASKNYNKGNYQDDMPLKYFLMGKDNIPMEEHTKADIEKLLTMLAQKGEVATEKYIRRHVLRCYPGAILAECICKINSLIKTSM